MQEVKVQAVVVIGVLARDNWQVRDILFYAGFYDLLLAHLHDNTPLPLMEKITWAMAFFCGSSHAAIHGQPPSPSSSLQPDIKTVGSPLALAKLMYLLQVLGSGYCSVYCRYDVWCISCSATLRGRTACWCQ